MTATIQAKVIGAEQVAARFNIAGPKIRARLMAAVQASTLDVEAKAKDNVRGPRPQRLEVKTGRLSRSINSKTVESADAITGSVGTNVKYGRFWELGFSGPMQVRPHTRQVTKVWGRTLAAPVTAKVGAFTRHLNVKPRPFLQPALDAAREATRARLADAIKGVL